jgi:transcriptional regulator GlxA family with amidase domain
MKSTLLLLITLVVGAVVARGVERLSPPTDGRAIRVAVVVTQHSTLIDFAGPWEVFQDVQLTESQGAGFELYTVSDDTQPVEISAGMKVVPNFSYANAPEPDIVVVGAQMGSPATLAWLRKQAARVEVLMSVCTGASKLAAIGLLDGKNATTHHDFVAAFFKKFPKVNFQTSKRFVQADAKIITAGGLTSGIDAALHVVERYYGRKVAERTAAYMEYEGTGWKRE